MVALHQALDISAPGTWRECLSYLLHLEQRGSIARAAERRLLSDPCSWAEDYASEGGHILIQIADLATTSAQGLRWAVPGPANEPAVAGAHPRRSDEPS
jgi:hypothetical protein